MQQVKEIVNEGEVTGIFLILESQYRTAKNGNNYAALKIGDKTGEIYLKVWDVTNEIYEKLQKGKVIKLNALAKKFNGVLQLEVDGKDEFFKLCTESEYDPAIFLPTTPADEEKLWEIIDETIESIKFKPYKALLDMLFADLEFRDKFTRAPAALKRHHAYLGGLLEHTTGVVIISQAVANYYPRVNRDLLLTGALLHDLGKVETYNINLGFEGTDQGKLIGHLVLGVQMVTKVIETIRQIQGVEFFPPETELTLIHLLVSHHGIMEWGSPVEPVLLEGCILHHADHMDAEISKFQEVIRQHSSENEKWTAFDPNLRRAIFLPNLVKKENENVG